MEILNTIDVTNDGLYETLQMMIDIHNKQIAFCESTRFECIGLSLKETCEKFLELSKGYQPVITISEYDGFLGNNWNIYREGNNNYTIYDAMRLNKKWEMMDFTIEFVMR